MATENKNVAKEAKNPVLTVRYWKDLKCYWLVWTLVYAFKIKPLIVRHPLLLYLALTSKCFINPVNINEQLFVHILCLSLN